ncbi:MAG: hypothetical protein QXX79_05830 [Candidatus Bathyarchaeia archaeon]
MIKTGRLKEFQLHSNQVIKILQNGEMGFRQIHRESNIGSCETLSKTLRYLKIKGLVEQNPITRKYRLTKNGKIRAGMQSIAEDILSSQNFNTYSSDWSSEFRYIALVGDKDMSPNALFVAEERLAEQGYSWENAINKTLQFLKSNFKSPKEDWDKLFKGVKEIILIHVLRPWQFFEKLQAQIEKQREGVKP